MKRKAVIALILVICVVMACCAESSSSVDIDKSQAIWLNCEKVKDFYAEALKIDLGKVVVSSTLKNAMRNYPSDTVFATAICFAAMVPESELANLLPDEKDAYIDRVFAKASSCCNDAGILVDFPKGTCSVYMFFYAYGTRDQIEKLTCANDVALYIAATLQYK